MTKIIIFGGRGFIGQHVVERLAKVPSNEIVVFSRPRSFNDDPTDTFSNLSNVSLIHGDFFNRSEVETVLQGADFVFHLISGTNPALSHNDPLIDIDTNIRTSVELLQACADNNIKKVIFFSSGGTVYGDVDSSSIKETHVPLPFSPYGIGKLTIEHYLEYFKHRHDLDYVVYRIANPYGPGQNIFGKQGVIPIFMRKFLDNEELTVYGDGSMKRDYLYIDDLARMIASSYDKPNQHPLYNIGSGNGMSVNSIIAAITECAGYSIPVHYTDKPSSYVQNSVLSIDRFVDEFKTTPLTSFDKGIKETWDYVSNIHR